MPIKLNTASGGGVILQGANTASDTTLTVPAVTATVLTDSAGVLNIGSGQVYKDASGNVGIGTSSPANRLSLPNSNYIGWKNSTNTAETAGITVNSSNNLVLYNAGDRVTIDSSGNLLVGGTTVRSAGKISVDLVPASNAGMTFFPTTNSSYDAIRFQNNSSGQVGYITCTTTNTSYVTSSDYRLKENVQPMTGALAKVAALKPCLYTWKSTGEAGEGFIAHELQAVVPQAVSGEKDAVDADGNIIPQGIDTSFLVATLTAAIQELKAEVDSLRAQVEAK